MNLRNALTGLLAAITVLLLSLTLVEYNQLATSGGTTLTSISTITSNLVGTITLNFTTSQVQVVEIIVFSASGSQTTSTLTVGQFGQGNGGFHNSGSLYINGLGSYNYLLASVAGQNPFVFKNVTFLPIPDKRAYTGPAYGCVTFNATITSGQTYNLNYCRFIGSGTQYVTFAPQDTKKVGMMLLPDNSVYVLVKEGS